MSYHCLSSQLHNLKIISILLCNYLNKFLVFLVTLMKILWNHTNSFLTSFIHSFDKGKFNYFLNNRSIFSKWRNIVTGYNCISESVKNKFINKILRKYCLFFQFQAGKSCMSMKIKKWEFMFVVICNNCSKSFLIFDQSDRIQRIS